MVRWGPRIVLAVLLTLLAAVVFYRGMEATPVDVGLLLFGLFFAILAVAALGAPADK